MTIGGNIRKFRTSLKLTQKELGDLIGTTQQMIAQYENGRRNPKVGTIKKIADALGVPFEELAEWNIANVSDIPEDFARPLHEKQKEDFSVPTTITIHFEDNEFTEKELNDIMNYIKFVKSRKKKDADQK